MAPGTPFGRSREANAARLLRLHGGAGAWSTFAAAIATVTTAIVAIAALVVALCQIRTSNSIRTATLIAETYSAFVVSNDVMAFYDKIRRGEPVDWEHSEVDKQLLNKSLTLFDELSYLETQGLLHRKARAWEYVASEIQYFASNNSVWDYIAHRIQEGRDKGFPNDIIPFTGFPDLLHKIPKRFRAKSFPRVPDRYMPFLADRIPFNHFGPNYAGWLGVASDK